MRLSMALLPMVAACGFQSAGPGGAGDDDAPGPDAKAPNCFGDYVTLCYDAAVSTEPPALPKAALIEIDTDGPLCDRGHDQDEAYCVISGATIEIPTGTTLRAFGSRPLILLATGGVEVHGTIDVSSTTTADTLGVPKLRGAGAARAVDCVKGGLPSAATGSSGGFGGSFGGEGGRGEQISGGGNNRGEPAAAVDFPPILRGGCPGGAGAMLVAGPGGEGGSGGGAIAIIASDILIDGDINASGAGGGGGILRNSGGGGGGSGGMIFLDTTELSRSEGGHLFANGGGGGEGGAGNGSGQSGKVSTAPNKAGDGGGVTNGSSGGNGGAGSSVDLLTGSEAVGSASMDGGGGGGGGGAGYIHAPGFLGSMIIAPPSTNPK